MDDTFQERLEIIKVKYDLKYSKLQQILGVSKDTAVNYLIGRTKMPMDKILSLAAYLRIDAGWLLRGIGDNPAPELSILNEPDATYKEKSKPIPYYDVDVMLTPIEVFNDQTTVPAYEIDMPGFSDCAFAINAGIDNLTYLFQVYLPINGQPDKDRHGPIFIWF